MNIHDTAPTARSSRERTRGRRGGVSTTLWVAAAALAVSAAVNHRLARKAERENPPGGRFIRVNGVRLHYVDRGRGAPLVLLHGNGSMISDFESSGLLDRAAEKYRVIAFDRPGYGHSSRPRRTVWTPAAQADLIHEALTSLGVHHATVLGHSWGCPIAVALADRHPDFVSGLVLASGYYYPTARPDFALMSGPAVPLLGDVMRYTVLPVLGRLIWPRLMRKLFGPRPVPDKFKGFPREMATRPSQLRASAAESALLIPAACSARKTYPTLSLPVAIIAGADDRLVNTAIQSHRLHREIRGSSFESLPGEGHMIHQTATDAVLRTIDSVSSATG